MTNTTAARWLVFLLSFSPFSVAGIFFVLPCIETYQGVDLRTITLDVPPQEVKRARTLARYHSRARANARVNCKKYVRAYYYATYQQGYGDIGAARQRNDLRTSIT